MHVHSLNYRTSPSTVPCNLVSTVIPSMSWSSLSSTPSSTVSSSFVVLSTDSFVVFLSPAIVVCSLSFLI